MQPYMQLYMQPESIVGKTGKIFYGVVQDIFLFRNC